MINSLQFAGRFPAFNNKLTVVTTDTTPEEDQRIQEVIGQVEKNTTFQKIMDKAVDGFEIHYKRARPGPDLGCGIKAPGKEQVGWRQDVLATLKTIKGTFFDLLFDIDDGIYL